jgi:hypothetical protein
MGIQCQIMQEVIVNGEMDFEEDSCLFQGDIPVFGESR